MAFFMIPELLLAHIGNAGQHLGLAEARAEWNAREKKFSNNSGQHCCWTDHLPG
jgi:hypothetical protein